jgi:hypothetical protein
MKLSRTLPRLMASGLALALMLTAAQKSSSSKTNAGGPPPSSQKPQNAAEARQQKPKIVTVILHGLMIGRNKEDKRFELGIVQDAVDHKFVHTLYVPKKGCKPILLDNGRTWEFEVRNIGGGPIPRNIRVPHEDYSHILNIEDELQKGRIPRRSDAFGSVFYFYNGEVKTHTPTVCLCAKKRSEATAKPIGSIAEVAMVEITVDSGQELVLKKLNDPEKVPLRRSFDEIADAGEEIRLLNLPFKHGEVDDCEKAYDPVEKECTRSLDRALCPSEGKVDCSTLKFSPTHYQFYYYEVFDKKKRDRFELGNPYGDECFTATFRGRPRGVPPYRCGMVLISHGKID